MLRINIYCYGDPDPASKKCPYGSVFKSVNTKEEKLHQIFFKMTLKNDLKYESPTLVRISVADPDLWNTYLFLHPDPTKTFKNRNNFNLFYPNLNDYLYTSD